VMTAGNNIAVPASAVVRRKFRRLLDPDLTSQAEASFKSAPDTAEPPFSTIAQSLHRTAAPHSHTKQLPHQVRIAPKA